MRTAVIKMDGIQTSFPNNINELTENYALVIIEAGGFGGW
jgi:hypothetical protein